MDRVNQAPLGFETSGGYKEAITLLLQLRSPKLSNSSEPTVTDEVLSESLQLLSEDDLCPTSEAVSSMDNIEGQLGALRQGYAFAKAVYQVLEQYSRAVLLEKYHIYRTVRQTAANLRETYQKYEGELQRRRQETKQKQEGHTRLAQEQALLTKEKLSPVTDDLQRLVEDCIRSAAEKGDTVRKFQHKEIQEEEKSDRLQELRVQYKTQSNRREQVLSEMKEVFD